MQIRTSDYSFGEVFANSICARVAGADASTAASQDGTRDTGYAASFVARSDDSVQSATTATESGSPAIRLTVARCMSVSMSSV